MKPHILFVDDEQTNLRIFKLSFKREYVVHLASSAQEALSILRKQFIDMVITDFKMPVMNGMEFLKIADQVQPQTPKMLLTGSYDITQLYKNIDYPLAFKPWDIDKLAQEINKHIG